MMIDVSRLPLDVYLLASCGVAFLLFLTAMFAMKQKNGCLYLLLLPIGLGVLYSKNGVVVIMGIVLIIVVVVMANRGGHTITVYGDNANITINGKD